MFLTHFEGTHKAGLICNGAYTNKERKKKKNEITKTRFRRLYENRPRRSCEEETIRGLEFVHWIY